VADWTSQYADDLAAMQLSLGEYASAVEGGDLSGAARYCEALQADYAKLVRPMPSPPDDSLDTILDRARDGAFYAQRDCDDALSKRDLPKLTQTARDANDALGAISVIQDATQGVAVHVTPTARPSDEVVAQPAPAQASATSVVLTIDEKYGAALRAAPDSSAPILVNVGCGTVLPVVQAQCGWFQVKQQIGAAWVGGARVVTGSSSTPGVCVDAPVPPYQMGDLVYSEVASGCLSVRPVPSNSN
jgi:hypothetical protein